jgi:hypothetical protein
MEAPAKTRGWLGNVAVGHFIPGNVNARFAIIAVLGGYLSYLAGQKEFPIRCGRSLPVPSSLDFNLFFFSHNLTYFCRRHGRYIR